VVDAVRSVHGRKFGFMAEFELVVSGDKPRVETFAETVKRRWEKQTSITPPFFTKSLRQFAPHFSCDNVRYLAAMCKVIEFQP